MSYYASLSCKSKNTMVNKAIANWYQRMDLIEKGVYKRKYKQLFTSYHLKWSLCTRPEEFKILKRK